MDLHVLILLLLSTGAIVQSKPKLCNGVKQTDGEEQKDNEGSARSFNRLGILRPGLIFRGSSSTADLPQSNNKRPGTIGLLHGSGGVPNGGYGMIHGGGEKQTLTRKRIFGQGVGLRNNSLSQKIGNLINYQTFGILSGNSLNVNNTQQNNSGPSYQVYLPSGLQQIQPVGGQSVGGGGGHGGTGGGLLNHAHRPHHHTGGAAVHQGGHLSGLLGHHHNHPHHGLHPLTHHSHHGSHGPLAIGARPGHHQLNGGILGATLLSGGGAGSHHGKPGGLGGLGLIHGGLGGGEQTPGNIIGHRPLTQGTLGLIHGAFGNQGLVSNSGGSNAAQTQQHHGGLLGFLHNGLGGQGVLIGGVGGGGSGLGSSHIFGQQGVLNLIHGGHSGAQGGNFQTVTSSELKPGHVYLHLGAIGSQHGGGHTSGTADNSFQSAGGSSIGSGQVYGQGGRPALTQSGQGVQGQIFGTGSIYQTGGSGTSQSGHVQSQHNLHQGTISQEGATTTTSNTGGYVVIPAQQSYQGSIYETQWSQPSAVSSTAGSTHVAGTAGSSSGNFNGYNQVNQGSSNFVSGNNVQSLYGNQNTYEGNNNHHGILQSTNGNYYNSGKIPTSTNYVGAYGSNQGSYPNSQHDHTFGHGNIYGGTSTHHSHQSSSSSSFASNSSAQDQESSSQQSYYSGGNLVGVNSGDTSSSAVLGKPLSVNYVGGDQGLQQSHLNSNSQGQSNYISGTNSFHHGGGASGQYMGDISSAYVSGSYPHMQDNKNTIDQQQGNYAHGSVIYVIQQNPLADEESYTGDSGASVSGSLTGFGSAGSTASSMYNSNNLADKPSSVSGGSGISTSQNSALSASEGMYSGASSSSSLQSGSHDSNTAQSLSTSGNILPAGSSSHSFNSSPSGGSGGYSGSTGSSYNTQYSQPMSGSAATQTTGSSSQHYISSNAAPQYGSAVAAGTFGSSSSASSSTNVHNENGVSDGVTGSWQSFESGGSPGSSNGEVVSTQTNGMGQYGSAQYVSSYPQTNNGIRVNTSGSNSMPTKATSSSLSTNQVILSGSSHTSSGSSGESGTSVSSSNAGETHGSMSSTHINSQYGLSGTKMTPSSNIVSKNNESLHNEISVGQREPLGPSLSASSVNSEQQISATESNLGTAQQQHIAGPSQSSGVIVGGESGYSSSNGAYSSNYGGNSISTSNTLAAGSSSHLTASGNSEHSSAQGSTLKGGSGQFSTNGGGQGAYI